MFALDDVESADAGTDVDTDSLLVLRRHFQPGLRHRLGSGGQREVDESRHLARFLLLDELEGIEVLDFGGEGHREVRDVEGGDGGHPAPAGQ